MQLTLKIQQEFVEFRLATPRSGGSGEARSRQEGRRPAPPGEHQPDRDASSQTCKTGQCVLGIAVKHEGGESECDRCKEQRQPSGPPRTSPRNRVQLPRPQPEEGQGRDELAGSAGSLVQGTVGAQAVGSPRNFELEDGEPRFRVRIWRRSHSTGPGRYRARGCLQQRRLDRPEYTPFMKLCKW